MVKQLLVCGLGHRPGACFQPMKPSAGHMRRNAPAGTPAATIPPPVQAVPTPPQPKPTARAETYSVVVNNVSVRELLFALARDAKVNVDIHPGITGTVTLNAIDQTLPQLLTRIAKQVDMRYELDGPNLLVMPDSPYLRIYRIDYVNMERADVRARQRLVRDRRPATGAGGAGGAGGGAASGGGGAGQNTSRVQVQNREHQPVLGDAGQERRGDPARDRQGPAGAAPRAVPPVRPRRAAPAARRSPARAARGRSRRRAVAALAGQVRRDVPRGVIGHRQPEAGDPHRPRDAAPAREAPGVSRPGAGRTPSARC